MIICNHHLLFVDSASRLEDCLEYSEEAVLPPFRHLVVDEAHNMERHATDLFTETYSSYSLRRQMEYIYDNRGLRGNGTGRLLDNLQPYCPDKNLYQEILDFYALVTAKAETLNMATLNLLDVNNQAHLLCTKANMGFLEGAIGSAEKDVYDNGKRLVTRLLRFADCLTVPDAQSFARDELRVHIDRISQILDRLGEFISWQDWGEQIHYLDIEKHAGVRYVTFNIAPLEVAPVLADALSKSSIPLCAPVQRWICTTISHTGAEEWAFRSRTGLTCARFMIHHLTSKDA